jgi:hypothetical protein
MTYIQYLLLAPELGLQSEGPKALCSGDLLFIFLLFNLTPSWDSSTRDQKSCDPENQNLLSISRLKKNKGII